MAKRGSLKDDVLEQLSSGSNEAGTREVHEQVAGMYRKIQNRVLDNVYLKCSPVMKQKGRQSLLNQESNYNSSIVADRKKAPENPLSRSVNFARTANASL